MCAFPRCERIYEPEITVFLGLRGLELCQARNCYDQTYHRVIAAMLITLSTGYERQKSLPWVAHPLF